GRSPERDRSWLTDEERTTGSRRPRPGRRDPPYGHRPETGGGRRGGSRRSAGRGPAPGSPRGHEPALEKGCRWARGGEAPKKTPGEHATVSACPPRRLGTRADSGVSITPRASSGPGASNPHASLSTLADMEKRSSSPATPAIREPGRRTYLMCRPAYYAVEYAINPWMDTSAPVDTARACAQWETLADVYTGLGHEVLHIEPEPGLPDMVYAANGAFVVDGIAYGARFRFPERGPEADAHEKWHRAAGRTFVKPEYINEGEGDFTYLPGRELILAGWGFRTDARAHAEAADVFGRQVVSLRLVDPSYYHLDTALAPLDDERIAYYPEAFAPGSRLLLERLFPDAVIADAE